MRSLLIHKDTFKKHNYYSKMSDIQSKVNTKLTQVTDFLTGNKTATTIPFDPNSTKFPSRKDVPRREDAPEGA